ncbi:hypothetical protein Pcinc_011269 [Petrolisthes cinctipes]|uniref:Uncharacterized protein n=1 Tax=Petrolisthes cinctipes TaxID=88211 RepID=A0AAE1G3V7_PETCI|nr:hypothetical protein Pcinc_011269 [Petrolisthes cinctipes]
MAASWMNYLLALGHTAHSRLAMAGPRYKDEGIGKLKLHHWYFSRPYTAEDGYWYFVRLGNILVIHHSFNLNDKVASSVTTSEREEEG